MAYLGNDLQVAFPTYRNIDDISGSFNGVTTSFPLTVAGVAPIPAPINSQQCLISVNGVVQRPDDSGTEGFRLSGGNIIFASAPAGGVDFFGVILAGADYVNIGANFPSGTAVAPSITFDSDLDTGIYNPAGNQIGFTTSGVQRLVINSSGQISGGLGTAAAPVISFISDPNTGIYSPGADQVAISTGGSGRLFVDASGRVGVGVSSLGDIAAGYATLQIGGTNGGGVRVGTSSAVVGYMAGSASGVEIGTTGATALNFFTNNQTRATITSAGLVGIGTSSPNGRLDVADGDAYITKNSGGDASGVTSQSLYIRTQSGNLARLYSVSQGSGGPGGFGGDFRIQTKADNGALADRFTINYLGNVGIGTTSPARALDVNGSIQLPSNNALYINGSNNYLYADSTTTELASATSIKFVANSAERLRIDSSGRLLVGTSSALTGATAQYSKNVNLGNSANATGNAVLAIGRGAAATSISSGNTIGSIYFTDNGAGEFASIDCFADAAPGTNDYPGRLVFSTTADGASSPTERMRIGANGAVAIGTTDTATGYRLNIDSANVLRVGGWGSGIGVGAEWNTAASATSTAISFTYLTTEVGKITTTSTATAYVTSSDYRLKENVSPVSDGITRLQQLKPSRFNFIADPDKTVDGFIAHEVQAVVPEAITGTKDEVDDDGNPIYQGIDQSKLVPLLTAALQEAVAKIESLEARLTAAGI